AGEHAEAGDADGESGRFPRPANLEAMESAAEKCRQGEGDEGDAPQPCAHRAIPEDQNTQNTAYAPEGVIGEHRDGLSDLHRTASGLQNTCADSGGTSRSGKALPCRTCA